MELELIRKWNSPKCTIGELNIDGSFECYTLEDIEREVKVPGQTAIPIGRYEVQITHSPRFGVEMPILIGVPGFSGIRIHTGNTAKDTEGCILVGDIRGDDQIFHSLIAFASLFQKMEVAIARGEKIFITIRRS